MWQRLCCAVGFHDWKHTHQTVIEGSGYTDAPMDYEPDTQVEHYKCSRCPAIGEARWRGVCVFNRLPVRTV